MCIRCAVRRLVKCDHVPDEPEVGRQAQAGEEPEAVERALRALLHPADSAVSLGRLP